MTVEISNKIRNMGFICALLVISIHVVWPCDSICLTWYINEFVRKGVATIAVPYFFIVSGYLLAAHFDENNWYRSELVKRVFSLVIPFFAWSFIAFVFAPPFSVIGDIVKMHPAITKMSWSLSQIACEFGLDLTCTPNIPALWYMRCLFIFIVIAPVFNFLVDKFRLGWLIVSFFAIMILAIRPIGNDALQGFFTFGFSLHGMFYFSVGIYLRRFNVEFYSRICAVICLVGGMTILCVSMFLNAGAGPW